MVQLREVELKKKRALYRLSKTLLWVAGAVLIIYGCYFGVSHFIEKKPLFWLAVSPIYLGSMMILISIAMKLEWFTDVRRFW